MNAEKIENIYIHSHGIPRVLFDVPFNMHLSIENSLYLPFSVIYTDVGTSHWHNIFKSVVRFGEAKTLSLCHSAVMSLCSIRYLCSLAAHCCPI